ncbi:MAG: hypothetical protein Q7S40_15580 [Opitutaceae bacterium]|nr:hypothetical protein [Opitutaceae bacterium]
MSKKIDRAVHGPGWGEVILGAVLSLVLGAILGATILILRPVVPGKELPKEADRKRGTVYYLEGSRDMAKARQAPVKLKAFVEGQSVAVTEEEVNALLASAAPPAAPKAAEKKPEPKKADAKKTDPKKAAGKDPADAAPNSDETVAVGAPNVRIRDGILQLAAPVALNVLGVTEKVMVQARGGFVKKGDVFTYEPTEMYVGSCPVQRLPVVSGYVRDKILSAQKIPDEVAASWRKLSNVAVEGNTIRLQMP